MTRTTSVLQAERRRWPGALRGEMQMSVLIVISVIVLSDQRVGSEAAPC
jgi:hypothetical protein